MNFLLTTRPCPSFFLFFRYENGKTKQPLALVKPLKVLDRYPDLLAEVRAG
jgi:HTH-type transcriptional regulator/antitoxin MqsA